MLAARSFAILFSIILSGCITSNSQQTDTPITFVNITDEVGLQSEATWKYGGPVIADLDNNGRYDLVLGNHHVEPLQLFWTEEDGALRAHETTLRAGDVHGIAAGDYDLDGDADLIVSVGGGNGTTPSPPRLLRNDEGDFVDVTEQAGIAGMGARGRSVRWVDLDADGDLDLLQVAARQLPGETGPRNILFENLGDGKFVYRPSDGFEQVEAERVLITDINNDSAADLVLFEPLSVWIGGNDFSFTDESETILPIDADARELAMAVAAIDFDNDGDRDLYVARGYTYYQTANNALSFDPEARRVDLRDEGNKGHDGMSFVANGAVELSGFWHWPRGKDITLPVFLGAAKTAISTPSDKKAVQPSDANGFPTDLDQSGWYLGHLGDGNWRLEWYLEDNLAWDIRASIVGVDEINPDWEPLAYNDVPDLLLRNQDGLFIDASELLPPETHHSNWGVTHGDFDNDGFEDLFVYRFGELSKRVPDVLMINQGGQGFRAVLDHGANVLGIEAHGDMGAAYDHDLDGGVDILSGDDNHGRWHLYRNTTDNLDVGNYLLVHVGYTEDGLDPMHAEVRIEAPDSTMQTKHVSSAGAVHSQSLLNMVHFGAGTHREDLIVTVRWRDGTTVVKSNVQANQIIEIGTHPK